jgi:hypothetical protein
MSSTILEKTKVQPISQINSGSEPFIPSQPPKLVAQWLIIDDKLVCKWNIYST